MRRPSADDYALLGLAPGASMEEIRSAYRRLVQRYHPDKHRGNPLEDLARERLQQINDAYQALCATASHHHRSSAPPPPRASAWQHTAPQPFAVPQVLLRRILFMIVGLVALRVAALLLRVVAGLFGAFWLHPVALLGFGVIGLALLGRWWARRRKRPAP